jgi:hypothetical protein
MPFCPKCKYEYRVGINICPDCEVYLVDQLPVEVTAEVKDLRAGYENWRVLARLTSSQYAEMVVEGLKSKEIPAMMISETGHFGVTGQLGIDSFRPIGGGYLILVPHEFAEDADNEAELMLGDNWVKARLD